MRVEFLKRIARFSPDTPVELLNVPAGHAAQIETPIALTFVSGSACLMLYSPNNPMATCSTPEMMKFFYLCILALYRVHEKLAPIIRGTRDFAHVTVTRIQ
jgi:hypothetical protein